jgi:hypothetical protein
VLLLALNFFPLVEGSTWLLCRSKKRCLALFKVCAFLALCCDMSTTAPGLPSNAKLLTRWLQSASGAEPAAAADATPAPSIVPSCDDASGMQGAANQVGTCPSLAAQLMAAGDLCLPGESSGGWVDVERDPWQVAASSWHGGGAAVSGLLTEVRGCVGGHLPPSLLMTIVCRCVLYLTAVR